VCVGAATVYRISIMTCLCLYTFAVVCPFLCVCVCVCVFVCVCVCVCVFVCVCVCVFVCVCVCVQKFLPHSAHCLCPESTKEDLKPPLLLPSVAFFPLTPPPPLPTHTHTSDFSLTLVYTVGCLHVGRPTSSLFEL